jgi:Uma2 family endonuclease
MVAQEAGTRRRFTRAEYHCMGAAGVFKPSERVELIRGEIITMSPIGRRHVTFVDNLTRLLILSLRERAIVSIQGPIVISEDSEPEPDVGVYRRRAVSYKDADRGPDDTVLLIEVAETSLAYDRSTKLRLYAEAGVVEYWIVDCVAEAVEVHRSPRGSAYTDVRRYAGEDRIALQAFPDVVLALPDIFA